MTALLVLAAYAFIGISALALGLIAIWAREGSK